MIYRGFTIVKGRLGWEISRHDKQVHVTDNQTQALEWIDLQIENELKQVWSK